MPVLGNVAMCPAAVAAVAPAVTPTVGAVVPVEGVVTAVERVPCPFADGCAGCVVAVDVLELVCALLAEGVAGVLLVFEA